jgi:hypothetical protein
MLLCCFVTFAGVPLTDPVAGIAMGLILEPDGSYVVLSDIQGSEDALGDMDFKVGGLHMLGSSYCEVLFLLPGVCMQQPAVYPAMFRVL